MIDDFWAGVALGALASLCVLTGVMAVTDAKPARQWRQQIIEHGAGRYNPVSGEFERINTKTDTGRQQ